MRFIKNTCALLVLVSVFVSIVGCSRYVEYSHCELAITMPREYEQVDIDEFDLALSNGEAIVGMIRLSFEAAVQEGINSTHSPESFAELYTLMIGREDVEIMQHGDVPYFTYTREGESADYFYMQTFYRTHHAYFIISFICPLTLESGYRVEFLACTERVYVLPEYL